MRINLSPKGKTVAGISLIGLALLVTGWTITHNPKAETTVPPPDQQPVAVAVVASQDNPLVKKVYAALAKESELKGENIKVESAEGGKIILSGKTSKPSKQALALQVAEKTAGKGKVIHQLPTDGCGNQTCEPPNHCCDCDSQGNGCVCQPNPCTHKKSAKSKRTN